MYRDPLPPTCDLVFCVAFGCFACAAVSFGIYAGSRSVLALCVCLWFRGGFVFLMFGASRGCWLRPFASSAAVVSFVLNIGLRLVLVVRVALVLALRVFTLFWSRAVVSFYFPLLFGALCWSTHTTK